MEISLWTVHSKQLSILLFLVILHLASSSHSDEDRKLYVNEFVLEFDTDNATFVEHFAREHGFISHGRLFDDANYFTLSHPRIMRRSLDMAEDHHDVFKRSAFVNWFEQQHARVRVKRDLDYPNVPEPLYSDPKWDLMWYLKKKTDNKPNMRVIEAWSEGYTGKNISVTILDDGIEYTHPDLDKNYDPLASRNINGKNGRDDGDPFPRPTSSNENRHGTRCAGEVAGIANNNVCGVGIAYDAKIGGVRMLDGDVTDKVEAASLSLNPQHVDIYSASWGPDDDGSTVDGPAKLAAEAFKKGVKNGRDGKGSIFVWASGNGGRHEDNCNCDGYTDSIYTLSISAVTQHGEKPWYSESCSSTLASTYSSGSTYRADKQIISTDLGKGCTESHTGTSAAAPLAAAICALALEANPKLTWRDMQHVVVQTAKSDGLTAEGEDWVENGAGYMVSHAFGFGMMDAYSMVKLAEEWDTVPDQSVCNISVISADNSPRRFSFQDPLEVSVDFSLCGNGLVIDRLEHVEVQLSLSAQRRGDLVITLTSPMGTTSKLLDKRKNDNSIRGFKNWSFMTTHSWDEQPYGTWMLKVVDDVGTNHNQAHSGQLAMFNLILHGTSNADWKSHRLDISPSVSSTSSSSTTSTSSTESGAEKLSTTTSVPMTPGSETESSEFCRILEPDSESLCKVCYTNAALDLATQTCVVVCPDGQYLVKENYENIEKSNSDTDGGEQERSLGTVIEGYVCKQCAINHCTKCTGPEECLQCVKGATLQNNSYCVLRTKDNDDGGLFDAVALWPYSTLLNVIAVTVVFIIIMSVYFLWSRTRSYAKYKYVPSMEQLEEKTIDVFDVPIYKDEEDVVKS